MTALERRYSRLLRAYPSAYRAERGDEILDTLMAAAPHDRTWPTFRDARTLVLGGLRVRAAQDHRLSRMANLRLATMLGIAMFLAFSSAPMLIETQVGSSAATTWSVEWASVLVRPIPMAVVVAAFYIRRRLAVLTLTTTSLTAAAAAAVIDASIAEVSALTAVLVLTFAALAMGRDRMPRSWLWLVGVAVGHAYLWLIAPDVDTASGLLSIATGWPGFVIAGAIWIAVDARLAMAITVALSILVVFQAVIDLVDTGSLVRTWPLDIVLVPIIAALGLPASLRVRRQAAL
jgi:hypothetical protein